MTSSASLSALLLSAHRGSIVRATPGFVPRLPA